MNINRRGGTRTVFEFEKFVIKIPNLKYGWCNFIRGLISNIDEGRMYGYSNKKHLLCPVKWYSKSGFILIMEKADVKAHWDQVRIINDEAYCYPTEKKTVADDWRKEYYKEFIEAGHDDIKPDNFGIYKNRLVKIDYA